MNKQRKNHAVLTVFGAFLLAIGYGSVALAQTATPKPSDYATDVQTGQANLQNDPVAAANAKEVNDSENDEGDVDNESAEVKEAIEPEEAVEPKEASEAAETGESDGGSESSSSGSQESSDTTSNGETGGQR